jgi:hypothetical protein
VSPNQTWDNFLFALWLTAGLSQHRYSYILLPISLFASLSVSLFLSSTLPFVFGLIADAGAQPLLRAINSWFDVDDRRGHTSI